MNAVLSPNGFSPWSIAGTKPAPSVSGAAFFHSASISCKSASLALGALSCRVSSSRPVFGVQPVSRRGRPPPKYTNASCPAASVCARSKILRPSPRHTRATGSSAPFASVSTASVAPGMAAPSSGTSMSTPASGFSGAVFPFTVARKGASGNVHDGSAACAESARAKKAAASRSRVAQASCLWGRRASCPPNPASAGGTPAGLTGRMPVPLRSQIISPRRASGSIPTPDPCIAPARRLRCRRGAACPWCVRRPATRSSRPRRCSRRS